MSTGILRAAEHTSKPVFGNRSKHYFKRWGQHPCRIHYTNGQSKRDSLDRHNNDKAIRATPWQHEFSSTNPTLAKPDLNVDLTVHQDDLAEGPIQCDITAFQECPITRTELEKYLGPDVRPASTPVEYHFLNVKRLKQFARVRMLYDGHESNLHVWKIGKNGGDHAPIDIPRKNTINGDLSTVDHYFELVSPGIVDIYLKTFCLLVCTLCVKPGEFQYEDYSIEAFLYIRKETDFLKVILYLVDMALGDYEQVIKTENGGIEANCRQTVTMPHYASLKEDRIILQINRRQSYNWTSRPDVDSEHVVSLSAITGCHATKKSGKPFSHEWLLTTLANVRGRPPDVISFNIEIQPDLAFVGFVKPAPNPTMLNITYNLETNEVVRQYEAAAGTEEKGADNYPVGEIPTATPRGEHTTTTRRLPLGEISHTPVGSRDNQSCSNGQTVSESDVAPRGELGSSSLNSLQEMKKV